MVASLAMLPPSVEHELRDHDITREQLMLHIQSINPTASAAYLARFSLRALNLYLAHLQSACEPRGRLARWLRPAETPAIIGFDATDDAE